MGLARRLEERLERMVEGFAARIFGGKVHPLELGEAIVRHADLSLTTGPAGPVAPNGFIVHVGGPPAQGVDLGLLQQELAEVVAEECVERGWRTEGPVNVAVVAHEDRDPAIVRVESSVLPGPIAPWARLLPGNGATPIDVKPNRAIVGRSGACDVHVASAEVSRRHALLWREAGRVFIDDLDSANGTYVDGQMVVGITEVDDGDLLALGEADLVLRLA